MVGKRTKLILGIVIGAVILFSGVIFGLAKTGKINLKMLADVLNSQGSGLKGEYYQRNENDASPVLKFTRTDSVVDFHWNDTSPGTQLNPDHFSVRWSGQIQVPTTGDYTFYTTADDGTVLYVNNSLLINNWKIQPATEVVSQTIKLEANRTYDIVLDYFESYAIAGVSLMWSGPGISKQVISQTNLFPTISQPPSATKANVVYKISTDCTDCPGRNKNNGLVNGIPIYYGNASEQLSNAPDDNLSASSGYFKDVPVGNQVFTINSPSSPNFNSSYQTLTVSRDVQANSSGTYETAFVLKKAKTTDSDNVTYAIHGKVLDSANGNRPLAGVTVKAYSDDLNHRDCSGWSTSLVSWINKTWTGDSDPDANYEVPLPLSCLGLDIQLVFTTTGLSYEPASPRYRMTSPFRVPDVLLSKPTKTIITGKITDANGVVITTNPSIFAKLGGFSKPLSFNTESDFSHSDANAVADSSGNYKIEIEPEQLGPEGKNIDICAMISKFPTHIDHKNWNCYANSDNGILHIYRSQTYTNIDIKVSSYTMPKDLTSFTMIGLSGVKEGFTGPEANIAVSCQNCKRGPWYATFYKLIESALDGQETDYSIKDIYNIAQSNSIIHELKINFESISREHDGYYLDLNDNFENDDDDLLTIQPSEISAKAYVGADGSLYLDKDLFFRSINDTRDQLIVVGKLFDAESGETLNGAGQITVSLEVLDEHVSVEAQEKIFSDYEIPSINYKSEELDYYPNQQYSIQVNEFSTRAKRYSAEQAYNFNGSESKYIKNLGKYVFQKDIPVHEVPKDIKVQYKSISTGLPINLTMEGIEDTDRYCELQSGELQKCMESYKLLDDKEDPSHSTIQYVRRDIINDDQLSGRGFVYLQTKSHMEGETFYQSASKTLTVYLKDNKADFNDSYYCEEVGGMTFCVYKAEKDFFFTQENRLKMAQEAEIVANFFAAAGKPLPVFLLTNVSGSRVSQWDDGPYKGREKLTLSRERFNSMDIHNLIHESSHIIRDLIENKPRGKYKSALQAARLGYCDIYYFKYKCFSNYSINHPNDGELWAEFAAWWVLDNDNIKAAMNDPKMSRACKTSLKNLYKFMLENFPKLKGYRQSMKTKTTTISSSGQVLGASTASDLTTVLAKYGFEEVPLANIDTIAPLSDMSLTPDQVASGVWLTEVYETLPTKDKLKLQLNILRTKTNNVATSASEKVMAQLDSLNTRIESVLIRLGFKISSASISGKAIVSGEGVANLEVKFGNKTTVTDKYGNYKLTRVPAGTFNLNVSDQKIGKTYKTNPASATISIDEQKTGADFTLINRKTYTLKGKVMSGSNPVQNGRIIVSDGQEFDLNANGEFNFNLKEGQYKLVIKNINGRVLKITNSGQYANLNKLGVTKDIDSLIWVK